MLLINVQMDLKYQTEKGCKYLKYGYKVQKPQRMPLIEYKHKISKILYWVL